MTTNQFAGDGRIYVTTELRQQIRDAYASRGWSSRAAAAASVAVGEPVSHQTVESFLDGRWTTTERRVLRALIAIHDLDEAQLAPLLPGGEEPVAWTFAVPARFWVLDGERRERAERAWVAFLSFALDPANDAEDEVAARRLKVKPG